MKKINVLTAYDYELLIKAGMNEDQLPISSDFRIVCGIPMNMRVFAVSENVFDKFNSL